MSQLKDLKPTAIWHYFEEICQIPRPSKKEEQILAYLLKFAADHKLPVKQDKAGNVLITKPATAGFEHLPTVVLQSHVDMVCEKNSDTVHDFLTDPIRPVIDGEWVKASGTTLGADDGIGMAAQLALLASDDMQHGPVECLFTVDEETGLTGAFALESDLLTGKYLINLDSEDEGEIFIGCAGGIDSLGYFTPSYETPAAGSFAFKASVTGLKGGHSGEDINRGLGNAIKFLTRFLREAAIRYEFRPAAITGGNLRNAIAREAFTWGVAPAKYKEDLRVLFNCIAADLEAEYKDVEPGIKCQLESADMPEKVFTSDFAATLINTLYALPHGVMAMSRQIEGLVETSTNLASIKLINDQVVISTSQRSSIESARDNIAAMVESIFDMAGANTVHSDGYPGWAPNRKSPMLAVAIESYKRLFGIEPKVKAIHAGLECGLFLKKYPHLDMISIGPTVRGAHSPDERIHILSVEKFTKYLGDILLHLA